MNLHDYQQAWITHGGRESEGMHRARESDREIQDWWQQAQAFELRLREALTVPVPDDLTDHLLTRWSAQAEPALTDATTATGGANLSVATSSGAVAPVHASPSRKPVRAHRLTRWRLPAALAAAAVLAVALVLWRSSGLGELPQLAVAHLDEHASALQAEGPVPLASLRQAFVGFGRSPQSVPLGTSYVSVCGLGNTRSVHLVLRDSAGGAVTGYFLRKAPSNRVVDFDHGGQAGRYQPLADGGALILVSGERAGLARAASAIEQALAASSASARTAAR